MLGRFTVIITSGLPDNLHIGSKQFIQIALDTAVDRPGTQATAYHEDRFLFGRQAEEG